MVECNARMCDLVCSFICSVLGLIAIIITIAVSLESSLPKLSQQITEQNIPTQLNITDYNIYDSQNFVCCNAIFATYIIDNVTSSCDIRFNPKFPCFDYRYQMVAYMNTTYPIGSTINGFRYNNKCIHEPDQFDMTLSIILISVICILCFIWTILCCCMTCVKFFDCRKSIKAEQTKLTTGIKSDVELGIQ